MQFIFRILSFICSAISPSICSTISPTRCVQFAIIVSRGPTGGMTLHSTCSFIQYVATCKRWRQSSHSTEITHSSPSHTLRQVFAHFRRRLSPIKYTGMKITLKIKPGANLRFLSPMGETDRTNCDAIGCCQDE